MSFTCSPLLSPCKKLLASYAHHSTAKDSGLNCSVLSPPMEYFPPHTPPFSYCSPQLVSSISIPLNFEDGNWSPPETAARVVIALQHIRLHMKDIFRVMRLAGYTAVIQPSQQTRIMQFRSVSADSSTAYHTCLI